MVLIAFYIYLDKITALVSVLELSYFIDQYYHVQRVNKISSLLVHY